MVSPLSLVAWGLRDTSHPQLAMTIPTPVRIFYEVLWNSGTLSVASEILSDHFRFRGSLGAETTGRDAFLAYVQGVRSALADYRCDILDCVTEGDRAFAKMRFSGHHVASFRGFAPTGKPVSWLGAAHFRFDGPMIAELWVLGDLTGLDALLRKNQLA